MSQSVHHALVALFNQAVEAAQRREHQDALRLYRGAVDLGTGPRALIACDRFLATATMRAAFCLMDLERYDEALAELERARAYEPRLGARDRYELYLAYGNTLGRLGRLDDCFGALVQAISHAEDLGDYARRPTHCWVCILGHAERLEAWSFLERKAAIALDAARVRQNEALIAHASKSLALARRGLRARH